MPSISLLTLWLGAVVLAHSLRDNGTKAKLVVFVTPENLQESTVEELKVCDYNFLQFRCSVVFLTLWAT